ncbi:uncharacterized protein KY384_004829 [Bacidia gigantensis]|uniref:uncharacterized protein n=1 Tax=Bacidia gigantensis TaxID=2732470 RepID=UPI001D054ECF|nr:uncharacterized protein KY384_004829 [Bacidia gigantensis]KAG8530327.1 hypothetical protein KY384_004829 [Bacidia gigantensis]
MHAFAKFFPLAFSALAFTLPADIEKRTAGTAYDDNFDDLKTSVITPQLFPVGLYHGIQYGGVVVLEPIEGAASVVPHSKPHQAGAAGPIDLLQLGTLTLNTYAQLVRGPGVKSFDLQSLYFGLGTDTGTTEGLAQGGVLSVTGFDVNGEQIPTQTLSYAPTGSQNQPLKFATFPDTYKNLANVSIGVAVSEPLTERTYIALDDVKHVNYS